MSACAAAGHLGPARPGVYQATDKAALERFFRTLRRAAAGRAARLQGPGRLPARQEPRAAGVLLPERAGAGRSAEWIGGVLPPAAARRSGRAARCPGLELSPAGDVRARAPRGPGCLQVPAHRADLVFDFLAVAWRTIQHYGVEIGGLRYDGPALNGHRNQTSPYAGKHAGPLAVPGRPRRRQRVWFQDPADNRWHELAVGARRRRRRAVQQRGAGLRPPLWCSPTHRFPSTTRRALAELLEQWGAGWSGHRAERRMAAAPVRAAAARLVPAPAPATAEPPPCRPSPPWPMHSDSGPEPGHGDDDSPGERTQATTSTPTRWRCRVTTPLRFTVEDATGPPGPAGWFAIAGPAPAAARPADRRRRSAGSRGQARAEYEQSTGRSGTPTSGRCAPRRCAPSTSTLDDIAAATARTGTRSGRRGDRRLPGLGKSTIAQVFAREFHQRQVSLYGPLTRRAGTTGYPSRTSA